MLVEAKKEKEEHDAVIAAKDALIDKREEVMREVMDYANVDEITRTRLRLPRRMYAGAIRRRQLIAPAAYVGGVVLPLPLMLDRTTKDGQVIKGFMPVLTASLRAGSFDHHWLENEDHFTTYVYPDRLAHDPTALHFYSAVRKMQEEVAGAPDGTPDVGHLSVHAVVHYGRRADPLHPARFVQAPQREPQGHLCDVRHVQRQGVHRGRVQEEHGYNERGERRLAPSLGKEP